MLSQSHKRSSYCGVSILAVMLTAGLHSAILACGYHDDVALARGFLNWTYPDSLYVVGAISRATAEGRLPVPRAAVASRDILGIGYRRTIDSQERLAAALRSKGSTQTSRPAFSIVLVEPMLWTHFNLDEGGELRAQVHVSGPERDDLIVVTGETVVGEIADGRLTIGEARRAGLIRLYGSETQIAQFLAAFREVGSKEPSSPSED